MLIFTKTQQTAPEVLRGEKYTEKCDIYSFGIVLWECVTRENPHEGIPHFQIVFQVRCGCCFGCCVWGGGMRSESNDYPIRWERKDLDPRSRQTVPTPGQGSSPTVGPKVQTSGLTSKRYWPDWTSSDWSHPPSLLSLFSPLAFAGCIDITRKREERERRRWERRK